MKIIEKTKKRLIKIAEFVHLKFFGHPMSDTMREFLGNLSWSFFGGIIAMGFLFLIDVMAGRILGPKEYGKYALMIAMANIFIIPMLFGLNIGVNHYVAKVDDVKIKKQYIGSAIFLFIVLLLLTTFTFYVFRGLWGKLFSVQVSVVLVTIVFSILLATKNLADSFIRGLRLFRFQSILKISEAVVIGLFFFLVYIKLRRLFFIHYIWSVMVGYIFFVGLLFWKLKPYLCLSLTYVRKLLRYGFYATVGAITGVVVTSFDKVIVNKYLGQEQLGIYNAYYMASVIILNQIVVIFINVFFSHLSSAKHKINVLKKVNRLYIFLFVPLFFIMIGMISLVILMFGEKYVFNLFLVLEFALLAVIMFYFTVIWWLIASQGLWGIRFTAMHGTITSLFFVLLCLLFKNVLTVNLVVIFLTISLFYAIIVGNLRGIKILKPN